MTTMEQLKENIEIFSKGDPITVEEGKILEEAVASMVNLIPCTACRYCCEVCPQGIEIPEVMNKFDEVVKKLG